MTSNFEVVQKKIYVENIKMNSRSKFMLGFLKFEIFVLTNHLFRSSYLRMEKSPTSDNQVYVINKINECKGTVNVRKF